MDKIKILGIGKSEYHNYFILEKKQEFFSGFRDFLVDIGYGVEDSVYEIYSFGRPTDGCGEPIKSKDEDIIDYVDMHYYFTSQKDYKIDLVFGKDKVFLIIYTNKDMQEEITENLLKFCIL